MTDLLSRPGVLAAASDPARRPLWLTAAVAGLVSAGGVLAACMVVALAGWFASDAGAHGTTRDALRVGADAWLLAHGAGLALEGATVTLVPLGLTVASLWLARRLGRWASAGSVEEDLTGLGLGAVVLAGTYAVVALVTALLASQQGAEPDLLRAPLGGAAVGLAGGGAGLLAGRPEQADELRTRVPAALRVVLRGALATALLLLAAGAVLVTTALLLDLGEAATVLSRLHADTSGGALATVLVAAVAPNAALLGGSYLLGPGFAVGTGTVVAPGAVVLGPVPAFPLLAALPPEGTGPAWAVAAPAVPALLAAAAAWLALRGHRDAGPWTSLGLGLATGLAGGLLATALVLAAGGAVGPGRMADLGAPALPVLVAAALACGGGGLVGGLVTAWGRRGGRDDEEPEPAPGSTGSTGDTAEG